MAQTSENSFTILFVCLGNICRSSMAEGSFRQVAADSGLDQLLNIESAGTGSWHIGNPPDERAQQASLARGRDISGQRAQQVTPRLLEQCDLILAMDESNLSEIRNLMEVSDHHKSRLFLEFSPEPEVIEVPDPYYGSAEGFEHVLDLIDLASAGLLDYCRTALGK